VVAHEILAAMQKLVRCQCLSLHVGHYSIQRLDLNRLDHSSSRLAQNDLAADRNAVLSYSKYQIMFPHATTDLPRRAKVFRHCGL
jgi:hypothetical protein